MASSAQILANRANALNSTGPKSDTGKIQSSMNSFRHGLTSCKVVLPGEDPAQFDAYRNEIIAVHQPANASEQTLAEELAAAGWRLNRSRTIETEVLKKLMGDQAEMGAGFASVLIEKPVEFNRMMRYITSMERAYYRAFAKLEKVQAERRAAEHRAAVQQAWVEQMRAQKAVQSGASKPAKSRPAKVSVAGDRGKSSEPAMNFQSNGFVSQNEDVTFNLNPAVNTEEAAAAA